MPVLAQSALPPAAVGATPALTQGAGAQAAFNQAPQPDCAADGCKALRIIDANAELYRLAALQRAEDEASSGPEQ
jgi:hypothetical protein